MPSKRANRPAACAKVQMWGSNTSGGGILSRGRGSTACCPSCLSALPTANRFHLAAPPRWVGACGCAPSDDRAGHPYLMQLGQHAVLTLPRGMGLN